MSKYLTGWFVALFLLGSASAQSAELPDFADLIEKNSPAVVKIEVEGKAGGGRVAVPQDVPEIFRRLFEDQLRRQPQQQMRSMGSGFVVEEDGYVLTNNHVVEGGEKITVRFSDRTEFAATVVGTDPSTDLALLKIDGDDLPTVKFGNSDKLKVGSWVVAIGSPFGLDYSASVGIVSALGRSLPNSDQGDFVPFIQTDVAINPGNSGGPLFNLNGEVIGINSQIYTRSGGSNGISFSIPSAVAQTVIKQLKEDGTVARGWFGVEMARPIDAEMAAALNLDKPQGSLLSNVLQNSPAEKAGLEPGDVIVKISGKPIITNADVSHVVGVTLPGEKVDVEVIRDGEVKKLQVIVGERGKLAANGSIDSGDRLGLVVQNIDNRTRTMLRLRGGVEITAVAPDSAAAAAGLQEGDILERIGRVRITDETAYRELIQRIPEGQPVAIRVFRNGNPFYMTLVIE
ncbi:Do family serine endopeptidase [Porticoccaceae bacterium LTM1]|nr:Do family serine endopeptidase [Porticoccaceae bacterium LTM1]